MKAFIFFVLGVSFGQEITDLKNKIEVEDGKFFDEFGREVLLHGVNMVYKVDPYLPIIDKFDADSSLTDQDILNLKGWGINFVRLGVLWEAAETSQGVWNQTYLQGLNDIAFRLGEQGIYTLVDGH